MSTLQNVTCDNCSASYSINVAKLKRERSRITCRRCQNKIVIFKSKLVEPKNEQATVNHEDEKTLVEEDRKPFAQRAIDHEPQTAVSNQMPPVDTADQLNQQENSDPTIRRNTPFEAPVMAPKVEAKPTSSATSTSAKSQPTSTNSKNKRTKDPLGLRGSLQLCAGMMVIGLFSLCGVYFADGLVEQLSFILGSSSLTMGVLWLVTSDFGFSRPQSMMSAGGAGLVALAAGAVLFSATPDNTSNDVEDSVKTEREPELIIPEVKTEKEDLSVDTEDQGSKVVANKKKSSNSTGPKSSVVKNADKAAQARQEMLSAANDYLSTKENKKPTPVVDEPEYNFDDEPVANNRPSDTTRITDPDEGLDEDLGFDEFDDLGLDEPEDDKKGLFGRKDKDEKKEEPAPKASASSEVKVDIPVSVLDIIIRNNKDVKGCYVQERSETGTFPKSIDVMFTLQPHGKVSSAYIASGPYVGSKFEGCIRSAFKKMTFPPFDSSAKPQTLKYNLKL